MSDEARAAAPNYFNPSMMMMLINLLWIFGVLWAVFGFGTVLIIAVLLNHAIDRIAARRLTQG